MAGVFSKQRFGCASDVTLTEARLSSAISKQNYENPSAEKKRHHNNCGSTRSGKRERARTTHIGRPIDDSDERKPIPAITFRFSSSEFLRESNHDEVPGTDHDEHVQQLSSVFHHWPLEASS